jgi:hypothetical protein
MSTLRGEGRIVVFQHFLFRDRKNCGYVLFCSLINVLDGAGSCFECQY